MNITGVVIDFVLAFIFFLLSIIVFVYHRRLKRKCPVWKYRITDRIIPVDMADKFVHVKIWFAKRYVILFCIAGVAMSVSGILVVIGVQ